MAIADGVVDAASSDARVAELQAELAARDRFIAAVGHELRNSVAPLAMLAESFSASQDAATLERRAQMLARNVQRLTSALDRVRDVTQLRAERLTLQPQEVDLRAVVREVVDACRADADAASVQIRTRDPVPVTGQWDLVRLRQIVFHLVTNAVRHSGGGPVDISVEGSPTHAVVTVTDHGRGIEPDRRPHLFNAFASNEARRSGGFGVGLWIAHTLCRHFRGSIELVGEHAPGACFRVELPRV